MKLDNAAHLSRPWRIHEIVPDFTLEDVWALPVRGSAEDFDTLLELIASSDPANADSLPTRLLWQLRDRLGSWLDLGRISAGASSADTGRLAIPGTSETTLASRLPEDLRDAIRDARFDSLPFVALYRTDVEFAAELSNQTVHAVMHLAWVEEADGLYTGQMAVYVKPRGALGKAYMAAIKPFRYVIVYPALLRQIGRAWSERVAGGTATG